MTPRLALAAIALVTLAALWLRHDAARGREAEIRTAGDAARLTHIEQAQTEETRIDALDPDARARELCRVLRGGPNCAH